VLRVNLRGVRDEPARDREHGPGIAKRHRPHGHPRGRNGTKRYRDVKGTIIQMVLERPPETLQEAKDYTAKTLDIENLIVEKMNRLTPDQYEAILRPVFKDDEMLMVTVGAVLGFLVGELQVVLVEHFGR
jgi:hypothetical protein